jgi:ubiquitin-protein ligase
MGSPPSPTPLAIKRICSDIKDLTRDPLDKEGIFHSYNEDNITEARIMIIGPEDTPYENGFYLFHFKFPNNYPFEPPSVKYYTQGDNTRFNPNLYTCGKVCLSLINTWDGPKWTSCQTIRSVLISLRGLVLGVKYPLQNEPGYETSKDLRAQAFNDVIQYQNYHIAVVKMINDTPKGFEVFKPQMLEHLKTNYSWYNTRLTQLSKLDNTKVKCSVYGMSTTRNFSNQLEAIKKILKSVGYNFNTFKTKNNLVKEDDYSSDEDEEEIQRKKIVAAKLEVEKKAKEAKEALEAKQKEKEEKEKAKLSKQKTPIEPAKNFDVGYKMKSIYDNGRMYVVKEVGKDDKKYKRWVLSPGEPNTGSESIKIITVGGETENGVVVKKTYVRKAPKEPAKIYENGHEIITEDNKVYLVKTVNCLGKEYKRWELKK